MRKIKDIATAIKPTKWRAGLLTPSNLSLIAFLLKARKYMKGWTLDIGTGDGTFDRLIPATTRIDIQPRRKDIIKMNAEKLDFPNQSYDTVVALSVLEHIQNDQKALKEIHRILKPGGHLIALVPTNQGLYNQFDQKAGHHRRYNHNHPFKQFQEIHTTPLYFCNKGIHNAFKNVRGMYLILRKKPQ